MDKKMTVLAMENSRTVQNFIKEGIYIGTLQQILQSERNQVKRHGGEQNFIWKKEKKNIP